MYSRLKNENKKQNIPIYFNHRREIKFELIITDYCLLKTDAMRCFLAVRLHGGSLSNFNFFNVNPQIFQRKRKLHPSKCLDCKFLQHF